MSITVLKNLRFVYPSENLKNQVVTIQVVLAHSNNKEYFCCIGEGSKDWVANNGRLLPYEVACSFFTGIENFESSWTPKR